MPDTPGKLTAQELVRAHALDLAAAFVRAGVELRENVTATVYEGGCAFTVVAGPVVTPPVREPVRPPDGHALTGTDERVLNLLVRNGEMSRVALARRIGCKDNSYFRSRLARLHLVCGYVAVTPGGYVVTDKGRAQASVS